MADAAIASSSTRSKTEIEVVAETFAIISCGAYSSCRTSITISFNRSGSATKAANERGVG
jgi:hypothetical protein